MHLDILTSAPRAIAALARDNGDLSALALCLGVVGGCMLSAWREQLRERKAQFAHRPHPIDRGLRS
jgi:transposase-like protein